MKDRPSQFAEILKEHAASFVQREANADPLITITRAEVTSDYSKATIFFTTIPSERENDAQVFLKRSGSDLRHYLIKKMNVKHVPFLDFSLDYGERHRQHIDDLVRETGADNQA